MASLTLCVQRGGIPGPPNARLAVRRMAIGGPPRDPAPGVPPVAAEDTCERDLSACKLRAREREHSARAEAVALARGVPARETTRRRACRDIGAPRGAHRVSQRGE